MSYPKPGKKPKGKIKNRSPRLHDLKIPKNKHCRNCGKETGTERFCHAEARLVKFMDGGGIMGGKINDNLTAWLCQKCDEELSTPLPKDSLSLDETIHAWLWARAIIKTHLLGRPAGSEI